MQHLSEKTQFLGFLFPQMVQKHKLGEVGKYVSIVYFLGNIYAKNCRNRTVCVKIIASCKRGTFFETQ